MSAAETELIDELWTLAAAAWAAAASAAAGELEAARRSHIHQHVSSIKVCVSSKFRSAAVEPQFLRFRVRSIRLCREIFAADAKPHQEHFTADKQNNGTRLSLGFSYLFYFVLDLERNYWQNCDFMSQPWSVRRISTK